MTSLLAQRYTIIKELGRGGQAHTSLALDATTQQHVVIKQLHVIHLDNWKAIELFERECSILAQLDHPAIPSYVDAFHDSTDDDAERFVLVQEFVEGETLQALIARGTRFSEPEILALLDELLHTLHYLHTLSPPVIHRDIKPSNLIRRIDGSWCLIDFGAIQAVLSETSKIGSTIVGTSGYMAPEQFMGHSAPATDLYALGATIIHALSHVHPSDIPLKRLTLDYHHLISCSPPLRALLDDLIAPNIEDRIPSTHATLTRLAHLNVPVRSTTPPHASMPRAVSGRVVFAALAVAIPLVLVLVGVALMSSDRIDDTPDTIYRVEQPAPTAPILPHQERQSAQKEMFARLTFHTSLNDSRLGEDTLTLTDITPHYTAYGKHLNVGFALLNNSDVALKALSADVSLINEDGSTTAAETIKIHQGFQPAAEPGDRMHADFKIPTDASLRRVEIALHSPQIVPATSSLSSTPVPLIWIGPPTSPGCAMTAQIRDETPPGTLAKNFPKHKLELSVTNSGDCAFQLVKLEKRLYDAQRNVVGTESAYLNASYDPPFSPGTHLLISLNSFSAPPFDSYEVLISSADLAHSPSSP